MNYISIKEASSLTGKSEKTIRRFALKPEIKAYTRKEGVKILIEVNYTIFIIKSYKKHFFNDMFLDSTGEPQRGDLVQHRVKHDDL